MVETSAPIIIIKTIAQVFLACKAAVLTISMGAMVSYLKATMRTPTTMTQSLRIIVSRSMTAKMTVRMTRMTTSSSEWAIRPYPARPRWTWVGSITRLEMRETRMMKMTMHCILSRIIS